MVRKVSKKKKQTIERKPIILPDYIKPQVKLWELTELTRDEDILAMSRYYDRLVADTLNRAGHNSLYTKTSKDPREHRNWIHFARAYEICRMKGWDRKLYIKAQFERSKHWEKMKYPYPSMLYSKNAISYFIQYLGRLEQNYSEDIDKDQRKRGKESDDLEEIIIKEVYNSAETISRYLNFKENKDILSQKAVIILGHYAELSPFYLWSVPWFHKVMPDLKENKMLYSCKREFNRITKSTFMKLAIDKAVEEAERRYNLPPNINL